MAEHEDPVVVQQRLMRGKIERAKQERGQRKEEEQEEEAVRKKRFRLSQANLEQPPDQEPEKTESRKVAPALQEVTSPLGYTSNEQSRGISIMEGSGSDSQWLARQRDIVSKRMAGVYDLHEKALAAEFSRSEYTHPCWEIYC